MNFALMPTLAGAVEMTGLAALASLWHFVVHSRLRIDLGRWSRSEPQLGTFLQQHAALSSEPWPVQEFGLYESHLTRGGAHYELVSRQEATSSSFP